MSIDFRPRRLIAVADLFDGRLEKHGVREHVSERSTEYSRCLTDGTNYVWVYISKRGFVSCFTRYNTDPSEILGAIDKEFDADIIDEYHPEFWEDFEGEVVTIDISECEVIEIIKPETEH
jgi:hypothetical protein